MLKQLRFHEWFVLALATVFVAVWQAPPHQPFEGLASYLPLHTALETFSFVISFLVFGVVWNAYARERAGNLVILACVFLAVGLIDFLHTLSYKGMSAFVTPGDPEKAINFWLAARYLAAAGLALTALRPWRPLTHPGQRYAWLAGALALTALVGWIGLFHQEVLPRTFIEGKGLTPLKIGAEYMLVALFAGAAMLFFLRARRGAPYDAMSLFTAAVVSILSELSFTLYSDVTDVFNLLGHVYKVIAYGFIYRAVFVESVRAPFRQVQEAEARYRAVVGDLPVLLCRFLPDGTLTFVNDAYCRYFGKTREELIGHSWVPLVPEEDREYVKGRFGALSRDRPVVAYEHRVVIPGGEIRWQRWLDRAVFEGERLVEYQSIGEDVTERRRAETALREAEERYRGIFAGARDGIVLIDAGTGFVADCNPEFERQCDRPLAQLKGLRIWELQPPEMREAARAKFEEIKTMGSGGSAELGLQRPDGTVVPVEFMATRIRIGGREFLQSICRDITERKQAEAALRHSEDSLKEAQRIAHIGNWDLDLVRNVLTWSDEIYRMFEIDPAKFGASYEAFLDAIHPDDRELVNRAYTESVKNRMPYDIVHRLRMQDGRIKYVNEHCETFYDETGKPLRSVGTVQDVTERVLIERRLRDGLERTVEAIAATIEMRDPYTAGHERRVVELATAIARELGLAGEKIEGLRFAALVHDIGKIRIPAEILSKPAALSPIEFEMIKGHCQVGYDILKGIEFPWPVARIVLEHHERLDGSGYPKGLQGGQTLLESKILAVADVVEAMASHRPYRPAHGIEAALAEIERHRGEWYDPAVVDACVRLFREKGFNFSPGGEENR